MINSGTSHSQSHSRSRMNFLSETVTNSEFDGLTNIDLPEWVCIPTEQTTITCPSADQTHTYTHARMRPNLEGEGRQANVREDEVLRKKVDES